MPFLYLHGRQMSTEIEGGGSGTVAASASVASSTLVPCSTGVLCRTSSPSTPLSESLRPTTPTSHTPVSCLESLRRKGQAEGPLVDATTLISSGWSSGTNVAYQSAWSQWCGWCSPRKVDPFSADIQLPSIPVPRGSATLHHKYRQISYLHDPH